MEVANAKVAVIVIGRNEGNRLVRCFDSVSKENLLIVYVDSGSTDGSIEMAKQRGVEVVNLDLTKPFTAARARNAGFEKAFSLNPQIQFVQFVDGDCQVTDRWMASALSFMLAHSEVAAVCGRRREIFPNASIYNKLCDLEWDTPIGETKACGGDVLIRVSAFSQVSGYRDDLIAGEEPELCVRLRQQGWKIWRIDEEMTRHDAAISQFKQWWKRAVRSGYAFAQGANIHGSAPEFHWVAESKRAMRWGCYLPLLIVFCLLIKPVVGWILLLIYPAQILRLALKSPLPIKTAFLQAYFLTVSKFAEAIGQLKFLWHLKMNQQANIIEYK